MNPNITVERIWSDEDLIQVKIATFDGRSLFVIDTYIGHVDLEKLVTELDAFKKQIHGGIYDLEFGKSGREFAAGAYCARLHFSPKAHGLLLITTNAESEWFDFGGHSAASRATLHLASEPASLDTFIEEMRSLASGEGNLATLLCR